MTRLHPDDIKAIARLVAEELRRPETVETPALPMSSFRQRCLESQQGRVALDQKAEARRKRQEQQ